MASKTLDDKREKLIVLANLSRELSTTLFLVSQSYAKGEDVPVSVETTMRNKLLALMLMNDAAVTGDGVFESFNNALKARLPVSSLPEDIADHEDLAAKLVCDLAGSVTLVEKAWFDDAVVTLRRIVEEANEIPDTPRSEYRAG